MSSDRLLINEEFIAMLNYYIATTVSAKSTDAEAQRPYYLERIALYKALDGQDGRRDWRSPLLDLLQKLLCRTTAGSQNVQARGRAGFHRGPTTPSCGCEVSQDDL